MTWVSSPSERLHGATVENLALDRPAFEHSALGVIELIETHREQRPQRGRHLDLGALGRDRQHLGDEERVAARHGAIRSRRARPTASPISVSVCSGSSGCRNCGAGQVGRRSISSGRAMHSSNNGAPADRSAIASTRSRNVSSPHCRSSNTTTSGACSSSSLRNAHAICVAARRRARDSPSKERIAAAGRLVRRHCAQLLHDLDHRPVRDPLAVRAGSGRANDPRVSPSERLGHQPRLADTRPRRPP